MSARKRIQADNPADVDALEIAEAVQQNDELIQLVITAALPALVAHISQLPWADLRVVWVVTLRNIWDADRFSVDALPELPEHSLAQAARFGEDGERAFTTYDPKVHVFFVFCCDDGAISTTARGASVPTYDQLWMANRCVPVTQHEDDEVAN